MNFNALTEQDFDLIRKSYKEKDSKKEAQEFLSDYFDVSERTVRNWANKIGVGVMTKNIVNKSKIMVYDIETARVVAKLWWSGKQYVNGNQLISDPKIITVAYKWLGEDKVHHLTWDKDHSDKALMEGFLQAYNQADLVSGYNNDRFDNRWVNARAMAHGLTINTPP